tara:strand:- start:6989 stop:7357 length:369 start_codon:yes stop_codon:yes gene_type:complete
MNYKVTLSNGDANTVKIVDSSIFKIFQEGGSGGGGSTVAKNLAELEDIDRSQLGTGSNRFVLVFDETTNAFKFVNPDEVVNAAAGSTTVPGGAPTPDGFSQETIDELDVALDNKIDLDAGTF